VLTAEEFLDDAGRAAVARAVGEAEQRTSAEIRVHLEDHIEEDILDHAAFVFTELGMQHTRERNGVLICISVADRLIGVVGDVGIDRVVPPGYWRDVVELLQRHFTEGRHADGLCEAVRFVGTKLAQHFPRRADDRNELDNAVSMGRPAR
jgi:uncharacterized membrane protein